MELYTFFGAVVAECVCLKGHILVFEVGEDTFEHGEIKAGKEPATVYIHDKMGNGSVVINVLIGKSGANGKVFEGKIAKLRGDIYDGDGSELQAHASAGKEAVSAQGGIDIDIVITILGRGWQAKEEDEGGDCLLYTSPSPRDRTRSRMPSSA
jgi:hypothetical protein